MRGQDPSSVQDFYGHDFLVTSDVLTPRPETEQLIDAVLTLAGKPILPGVRPPEAQIPENCTIIDVGTGSGCIAITLKLALPKSTIVATDISKKALKVAQKNAKNLGATPITFIISHLLQKVNTFPQNPDIIVANLPYVDKNWPWVDPKSLKDPDIALYADDGGLALIKELIQTANSKYLILEADPCQHEAIRQYAEKHFYILYRTMGYIQVYRKQRQCS